MIRRFPREQVILERTHLRFVNLANVLADSKVERAARVPSFVAVYLGNDVEAILMLHGEPVTAVRIGAGDRRVLPVTAVVERAQHEVERADVSYYAASEAQLCAMYATSQQPVKSPKGARFDAADPVRYLHVLRDVGFTGVLELGSDEAVHYIVFQTGFPAEGFIEGAPKGMALKDAVTEVLSPGRSPVLSAALYPPVDLLPAQAPKALVELYTRTIAEALAGVQAKMGRDAGLRCFDGSLSQVRRKHSALAEYRFDADGCVVGHTTAPAEPLTDAVGAWLFEALSAAQRAGGVDPSEVIASIPRDSRYVLEAQGFFERLPWAIAW